MEKLTSYFTKAFYKSEADSVCEGCGIANVTYMGLNELLKRPLNYNTTK